MANYSTEGLDQELVKQATRGGGFGRKDKARYDALARAQGVKKSSGKTKGEVKGLGRTQDEITARNDKLKGNPKQKPKKSNPVNQTIGSTGKPQNPIDKTATGESDVVPSNEQTQNVNQDNDINTRVNGSNNTVITEQDNSIRQYGGDNRSFVYNGGEGGNRYEDTPMSAATMSGFYDVDDSPAAQAKFNDMYTTMNRDNQKRYAGDAMKTYAKYGSIDARSYTDESMENALNRSTQYSFDRADRQTGHVFGDIWNDNYITEEWKMPSAPKGIESNAADIADKAKEDIEDI